MYILSHFLLMLHLLIPFVSVFHSVQQQISILNFVVKETQDPVSALIEMITFVRKRGHQMCDFGMDFCVGMRGTVLLLGAHLAET